jgi:alanine racemase
MRLVTEIVQLRDVPAGATVSYGALWRAERLSRLAVLPIGYADGLPRSLTGKAEVLVHGRRCPIVGAICMDIAVVDVTALGDAARVGDAVVLLGAQDSERIGAREFAERAGLIEYEVTCGISKRVPRVHA